MREQYERRIKSYLADREWYKLVDALEEVTNFWSYGRDFTTIPNYNIYIPTRHTLMKKPDMHDEQHDDLSYRYNVHRMTPYHYLNTLKGHHMWPLPAERRPHLEYGKPKFYNKWRRLSRPRMSGFSTINNRREGDGMWYQQNFG